MLVGAVYQRSGGHPGGLGGGERAEQDEVGRHDIRMLPVQFRRHVLCPGGGPDERGGGAGRSGQSLGRPPAQEAAGRGCIIEWMRRGHREGDVRRARRRDAGEEAVADRQPGGAHTGAGEDAHGVAAGDEGGDDGGDQGDIAIAVEHREEDAHSIPPLGHRDQRPFLRREPFEQSVAPPVTLQIFSKKQFLAADPIVLPIEVRAHPLAGDGDERDTHSNRRALSLFAGDGEGSPLLLNDLLRARQADARPVRDADRVRGPVEALGDTRQVGGGDADAPVRDDQRRPCALSRPSVTATALPSGLYLHALESRFSITRSSRCASHSPTSSGCQRSGWR